jgi:hypothetical protein
VIKEDRNAQLTVSSSIACPLSGTAVITGVDDQLVGEAIPETAAFPTGTYATYGLNFYPGPIAGNVRNLQIRYAFNGIAAYTSNLNVQDIIFVTCTRGIGAWYTAVYGSNITFCDVPTQFYDYVGSEWNPSTITTLVGKNDNDSDLLSNYEELVRWRSNPLSANTYNATKNDAEYQLTAVSGLVGTRVSITASGTYDPVNDQSSLEFVLTGTTLTEFHEIYRFDSAGQYWSSLFAGFDFRDASGADHYSAVVPGNRVGATFGAFWRGDVDADGLPDGFEAQVIRTIVGNADSSTLVTGVSPSANNGIADGDEDFDGDGIVNADESLVFATNPLVAQSTTDSDGDGLPDWYEGYIRDWTGIVNPGPWEDPDLDGIPNIIEFPDGDPVFQEPAPPSTEAARFVDFETTAGYSDTTGPASNPDFPGAAAAGGALGVTMGMYVAPSNPINGPGNHSATLHLKITPAFDAVVDIIEPDGLDGQLWKNVMLNGTELASDVWAKVNPDVLNVLRQRTLEYLRVESLLRISVQCRRIQTLMTMADSQGRLLQVKRAVSRIHTEITKLRAITVVYGNRFPNDWVGRFLRGAGRVATCINLYDDFVDFWQKLQDYRSEVALHIDCTAPAFLSLSIQQLLVDMPGLSQAAKNALSFFGTTPLFDPNPLGWYDNGGCN